MTRDNFSMLLNTAAAPPINNNVVSTNAQGTDEASNANRRENVAKSDGDLIVGFVDMPAATSSAPPQIEHTKPGTESIEHLKKFGNMALKPLRDLQLAEKMNALIEMEETENEKEAERLRRELEAQDRERLGIGDPNDDDDSSKLAAQSEQLARELQNEEDEEECQRIKLEADMACRRVAGRYDALVKFANGCPHGTYEEWIEFLLMGGGRSEHDKGLPDEYDSLMFENFYDKQSEYRKLWNDNLTLGLPQAATTLEGRAFVPAAGPSSNATDGGSRQKRTFSEDERIRRFGDTLREGKRQIAQVDKQMIKQGLGSAANVLSNVSSFALKPLRDLQLAEKLNAMNIDQEEEEAKKEIDQYYRAQEEKRDMEEAMRLKKEAEERCLNDTKDHLLSFIKEHPNGKYQQWIEELHPENAHDGTLLEGLGKTIDHRFFVEESDHRRLWNDNLFTFLDPNSSQGRDVVPARARQMTDTGEMVTADDILSGSVVEREEDFTTSQEGMQGKSEEERSSDLIAFD